jgi:hypothetical protein
MSEKSFGILLGINLQTREAPVLGAFLPISPHEIKVK